MPRIPRYVQVFHQCLPFHARAMIGHSGRTEVCWAGSNPCCGIKSQVFDGSGHEHRKILSAKHANKLWCIMWKESTGTNLFEVYIFSWRNFVHRTCHMARKPKSCLQKCCLPIFCPAHAVFASALSSVDGVMTGYFPFFRLYEWQWRFTTHRSLA